MSRLKQINHWNKQIQYKKQTKKNFLNVFLRLFAITPNASTLSYDIQSEEKALVDSIDNCVHLGSAYLRQTLDEKKTHFIKQEDA